MRFSIHTLGTRGDTQPYLALSRGLRAQGHEVLIVAPAQFADMAAAEGVAFAPLPAEFLAVLDSPEAKKVIGSAGTGFGAGFKLLKFYREIGRRLLDAEWKAASDFAPDAVLFHPKALGAPHIAAKLGVPLLLASPLPGFTPTSAFPTPVLPFRSLGPLNRASHALMIHGGSVMFGKTIRAWRVDALGLPARGKAAPLTGTLYGYSPHVLPKSQHIHVITGAPHDRLFPIMHATFHHGGAGTTGAALRAGKPTAICPFFGDQPFWARRVVALGVGPKLLDKKAMTADDLAAAFLAMDNPDMRARAADLGAAIGAENGVDAAVRFIVEGVCCGL